MNKKKNHEADMENANKGTSGQNPTHAKKQGNRGGQMNPNRQKNGGKSVKK